MIFTDVSKWNSVMNWNKTKQMGVEGVYLKASGCGDGGNYVDYLFAENSKSCNLPYKGAYHYFDYRKPGADQCKFFLDINGDFGNLKGALDLEDNGAYWTPLNKMYGTALKNAYEFVNEHLKETGYLPVLYISSYLTTLTDSLKRFMLRNFHGCPLWVAHYTGAKNPTVGGWASWAMWQYTSNGDGILYGNAPGAPRIDLNIVNRLPDLLKPNTTIEDPVFIPPVLTDAQKLDKLWVNHPELH